MDGLELDNPIWSTLKGGYKIPYNVSIPLKKLKKATHPEEMEKVFTELWNNLHHQGDVGIASYAAVPHLISICIEKRSLDWNFIGLCVLIENCRVKGDNPELPDEYQDMYFDSLKQFQNYLLLNFNGITDRESLRLTLALLATVNGQPELGRALELLDEDAVAEFLENH